MSEMWLGLHIVILLKSNLDVQQHYFANSFHNKTKVASNKSSLLLKIKHTNIQSILTGIIGSNVIKIPISKARVVSSEVLLIEGDVTQELKSMCIAAN